MPSQRDLAPPPSRGPLRDNQDPDNYGGNWNSGGASQSGRSSPSSNGSLSRNTGGLSPTERDERNEASRNTPSGLSNANQTYAGQERYSSSTSSKSSSTGSSKGRETRQPILIDLDGNGLTITKLDDSPFFFDIGGDGYKHRTAWAGAGDGVLVFDADGDGKISARKEVVLTDWDPSADSDMEALRQVFDTNHNGLLDAGDAQWSLFKVAVTRPDGTTEMKTLAQLGIQSLTLVADETRYQFADGSSIDGEAVFTRTDGTQGKASTATLAIDAEGFAVTTTEATNAGGERVITSKALDADGSVASQTVRTTSADGKTITTRFDNDGDGIVDRILSDVTIDLAGGSKQRTETSRTGAGVLMATTVTTTNADQSLIQINRDQLGGGYVTESETQQRATNNGLTITVADKAANGAVISSKQTEFSADRLTRTDRMDADGNLVYERALISVTIHNADGSLTKRDTLQGGGGNRISQTSTTISADGLVRSEAVDSDGDQAIDRNISSVTTRDAVTGASQIVEQVKSRDLTLITGTTTTVSADGLSKTVANDINGNGTADQTTSDVTVIAADQSRTQTVIVTSGNGTLLSRTVTTRAVDGLTGSKTVDANGDGVVDQSSTVVRNASGQIIETGTSFSANGVMLSRVISTTSADGLSTTSQADHFGLGTYDEIQSDVVVRNADGSAQQTLERRSGNNTLLEKVTSNESANGLIIETLRDVNGDSLTDSRGRDQTVVNADGSQVRTVETRSGNDAVLLAKEITNTSADRRSVVRTVDADGDGQINLRQTSSIALDGTRVVVEEQLTDSGLLTSKATTTTSANGLVQTAEKDVDGNGTVDARQTVTTVLGTDGGRTITTSARSGNQTLLSQEIVTEKRDGVLVTTTRDLNGDGVVDISLRKETVINAKGASTTTETAKAGTATTSVTTTSVAATGLSTTVNTDSDGNGTIDLRVATSKSLAATGILTEVQEVKANDNSRLSKLTVVTQANGKSVTATLDRNGDAVTDQTRVTALQADGSVVTTTKEFGAASAVTSRMVETVSRNGLTTTQAIDSNGDGVTDKTRVAEKSVLQNGSVVTTLSDYSGSGTTTLVERTVTTTSGTGLSATTVWSGANNVTTRSLETVTTLAQNGATTTVETYRKADGSLESQQTLTKSGDGNSITLTRDVDGNGVLDTRVTETVGNDGVKTSVFQKLAANGAVSASKTVTTSANGLVVTTLFDSNGDGTSETRVTSVTEPLADGSMRTTVSREALVSGAWQLKGREVSVASGNELAKTTQWDDTGSGSYGLSRSSVTVLNADGSRKTTETTTVSGATTRVEETVVSANGLTVTKRTDADGNGTFDEIATIATVLNANGSKAQTETYTKADGTVLSSVATTISRDGLVITRQETSAVPGWAARTTTQELRTLADGTKIEVTTTRSPDGLVMEKTTTTTSADQRLVTVEHDSNGDGVIDQRKVQTLHADGRQSLVETTLGATGNLLSRLTSTTSADGRQTVVETDRNGDGTIDLRKTIDRQMFADGSSSTVTLLVNAITGTTKSRTQETLSADGMVRVETTDVNNDGVADQTVREEALTSGIRKITVTNNAAARASSEIRSGEIYWNDTIPFTIETTVSLDGKTRTIKMDNDGDGRLELTAIAITQIDGSVTTTLTETNANGTIKARGTMTQSHDQRLTILTADTDNNGSNDWTVTTTSKIDGTVDKVAIKRDAAGVLTETKKTWIDSLGNIRSSETRDGSNRLLETYTRAADLTGTRTRYEASNGAVSAIETLSADDKLRSAVLYDALNAQTWTRVEQTYDGAGNKTLEKQFMDDGTRVELSFTAGQTRAYLTNYYDASNAQVQFTTYDFATGQTVVQQVDVHNSYYWSNVVYTYDTNMNLMHTFVMSDDGSQLREVYDPYNQYLFSTFRAYYYQNGFQYADQMFMDTGNRQETYFDSVNLGAKETYSFDVMNYYWWNIYHAYYNQSGFRYADVSIYDDGWFDSSSYNQSNDYWFSYVCSYDNYSRMYRAVLYKTNGEYDVTTCDFRNETHWSSVVDRYSSSARLMSKTTYYDNGDVYTEYWDEYGNYLSSNAVNSYLMRDDGISGMDSEIGPIEPDLDWVEDGTADATASVDSKTDLLVIDHADDGLSGSDGSIDQACEIAFALWPDNANTDMEGLRMVFDSNHDNILDSSDARWNEFRVWQDLNQNGVSEAGELLTMSEAGIKLFNLLPSADGTMAFSDGSVISGTITYETTDGMTRLAADSSFRYIQSRTEAAA